MKVGDRVKISVDSEYYIDNDTWNPKDIEGTITNSNEYIPLPFMVKWDNGESNSYHSYDLEIAEPKTDSIVETVINKFKQRSEAGIKKYNTTLDRNDLSTLEWLTHLQEELMDATLYIERLKKEYESTN